MKTCKARTHLRLVALDVMRAENDPFDEALRVAMKAMEAGASKAEAAMIFARAHCGAYDCPGCFEDLAR